MDLRVGLRILKIYLLPHIVETAPFEPSDPTTTATIPAQKNIITGISEPAIKARIYKWILVAD
jgi:hypothetical protein